MKRYGSTIAQFTLNFRLSKQLTQTELGDKMGVSVGYICNVEKGRHANPVMFCVRLHPLLDQDRQKHLEGLKQKAILASIKIREQKFK